GLANAAMGQPPRAGILLFHGYSSLLLHAAAPHVFQLHYTASSRQCQQIFGENLQFFIGFFRPSAHLAAFYASSCTHSTHGTWTRAAWAHGRSGSSCPFGTAPARA